MPDLVKCLQQIQRHHTRATTFVKIELDAVRDANKMGSQVFHLETKLTRRAYDVIQVARVNFQQELLKVFVVGI